MVILVKFPLISNKSVKILIKKEITGYFGVIKISSEGFVNSSELDIKRLNLPEVFWRFL